MNNNINLDIFSQLVNLHGVSGHERSVRQFMKQELSKYSDEIIQDKLGSIFGIKKGKDKPVIMIAGHMDEVGAMVTSITDQGFIRMIPIGGVNPEVMVSQNVLVSVSKDKFIPGIVGAVPPHITKVEEHKPISFDDLLLDVGADSKEHAVELGIEIGQQITFVNHYYFTADGKKIVSKAWDNRFGCGMAIEVLRELQNIDHPNTVIAGATVQEEVGLRGATTASQMVVPDLFIAIDVSPVGDFLSKDHPRAYGTLGKGFLVRFYDPRCLMNPAIKDYFEKVAKKNNIPFQQFLSLGGTDAAAAQYAGHGTLSTTIGLPGRYIHSTATMVHLDDMLAVKQMVLAIIKDFDKDQLVALQNA
ncbi:MAG: M42 family metallopeptidase [Bacilli bacterium]